LNISLFGEGVSVIIPSFNHAEYIEECINSVLLQTCEAREVIVVEDGSTDGSREILSQFKDRIILIEIPNSGACIARNVGAMYSTGKILAFLDSDDAWKSNMLEESLKLFGQSQAELVFCNLLRIDSKGLDLGQLESILPQEDWFFMNPGKTPFPPSATLITRSLFAKVGGWNTALKSPAEDFDFFRRCAKHTTFAKVESNLVLHREHGKSLTSRAPIYYFEDNVRAVKALLAEDTAELKITQRILIWYRLHLMFLKHSLKLRDIGLTFFVLRSFARALL